MSTLDPAVEIPKLTDKHRIVYRRDGAPRSAEMGLFTSLHGHLFTDTGDIVRFSNGGIHLSWLAITQGLLLEAVIPPALELYRGMLLEDAGTKELWVYNNVDAGTDWVSSDADVRSEAYIAERFAAGDLTIFTPEVS